MIKLNYHSEAEISVAENISFPPGSKEKKSSTADVSSSAICVRKPTLRKE